MFIFWPRSLQLNSLTQELNSGPWQWEYGVLTTGKPGPWRIFISGPVFNFLHIILLSHHIPRAVSELSQSYFLFGKIKFQPGWSLAWNPAVSESSHHMAFSLVVDHCHSQIFYAFPCYISLLCETSARNWQKWHTWHFRAELLRASAGFFFFFFFLVQDFYVLFALPLQTQKPVLRWILSWIRSLRTCLKVRPLFDS